jgi:DNA-binding transcriptional ArsR family regulator
MSDLSCCDLNDFLAALADETRQRIVAILAEGEMSVSELCQHFSITQSAISHHLAVLRQINLVIPRREGQYIFYRANSDCVTECCHEILDRFSTP